jgi:hypothetical protein
MTPHIGSYRLSGFLPRWIHEAALVLALPTGYANA